MLTPIEALARLQACEDAFAPVAAEFRAARNAWKKAGRATEVQLRFARAQREFEARVVEIRDARAGFEAAQRLAARDAAKAARKAGQDRQPDLFAEI